MLFLFSLLFLGHLYCGLICPATRDMLSGACYAHFSKVTSSVPRMVHSVVHALRMVDFYLVNLWLVVS